MKSYEQSLKEIYERARKFEQEKKRKRKTIITVISVTALAIIAVGISMFFFSRRSWSDDTSSLRTSDTKTTTMKNDPAMDEPSVYPAAWKDLSMAVIKWGKVTGIDVYESSLVLSDDNDLPVKNKNGEYFYKAYSYYEIQVEFIKVFDKTFTGSLSSELYETLKTSTVLWIPDYYAERVKEGDTALVFISCIKREVLPDGNPDSGRADDGAGSNMVVRLGVQPISAFCRDGIMPALNLYEIIDNRLTFPDALPIKHELLIESNNRIHKENSEIPLFEEGANMADLERFFEYLCSIE